MDFASGFFVGVGTGFFLGFVPGFGFTGGAMMKINMCINEKGGRINLELIQISAVCVSFLTCRSFHFSFLFNKFMQLCVKYNVGIVA